MNDMKFSKYNIFQSDFSLLCNHSVQDLGLLQLREGASGSSMRSPLCCLTILAFHTYISLILGKS